MFNLTTLCKIVGISTTDTPPEAAVILMNVYNKLILSLSHTIETHFITCKQHTLLLPSISQENLQNTRIRNRYVTIVNQQLSLLHVYINNICMFKEYISSECYIRMLYNSICNDKDCIHMLICCMRLVDTLASHVEADLSLVS